MKKKLGILTYFYNSLNYGGVLQAFALCSYINKNNNFNCELINYNYNSWSPRFKVKENRSLKYKNYIKKLKWLIIDPKLFKNLLKKNKKNIHYKNNNFKSFIKEYIPNSNEVYSFEDIKRINKSYDILICGSDQVWNPISMDPVFYMEFIDEKIKKISYAASFGADNIDEEKKKIIEKYLEKIDHISIREEVDTPFSEKIMRKLIIVPDPVFLIKQDEWERLSRKIEEKNYILTYFLRNDLELRQKAIELAKNKNLIIIDLSPDFLFGKEGRNKSDAGPQEFLGLIKNANYILTDSFHCTAFSIIFKKKFVVFKREKKQNITSNNRMKNMLKNLELINHLIGIKEKYEVILEEEYEKNIEEKLEKYRNLGVNFLIKCLNE